MSISKHASTSDAHSGLLLGTAWIGFMTVVVGVLGGELTGVLFDVLVIDMFLECS